MRQVVFEGNAFTDFTEWAGTDKDIDRNSFIGIGKPEALKHEFSGYWSRRITDEHRLVYKVTDTTILIASCKYHYDKK